MTPCYINNSYILARSASKLMQEIVDPIHIYRTIIKYGLLSNCKWLLETINLRPQLKLKAVLKYSILQMSTEKVT